MANAPRAMRMFPRGFIGAAPPPLVGRAARPFENIVDAHSFHFSTFIAKGLKLPDNHEVEALYASYIKQAPSVTSVDFRLRIIRAALAAFGSDDFGNWIIQQYQCPAVGTMHRRFIDDTLRYIHTGRREMSPMTWAEIIEITNNDKASEYSKEVRAYFGDTSYAANPFNNSIKVVDLIQMWVSVPNGIEDLLLTLHVLFGNY
jgi:hypothetical protein